MTDEKKQPQISAEKSEWEKFLYNGQAADLPEPQKDWKVKPSLTPMWVDPAESGIGKRIAYCRGQLDNLSLDALARYTKFFDVEGISRGSLFRYEVGQTLPGARELRILCNALWVPPNWLLMGKIETASGGFGKIVEEALNTHLEQLGVGGVQRMVASLNEGQVLREETWRRKWIEEARKAQPRN